MFFSFDSSRRLNSRSTARAPLDCEPFDMTTLAKIKISSLGLSVIFTDFPKGSSFC